MIDVIYSISGKKIHYIIGVARKPAGFQVTVRLAQCNWRQLYEKDSCVCRDIFVYFVRHLYGGECCNLCTHKWQRERWGVKSLSDRNVSTILKISIVVILCDRASEGGERERGGGGGRYLLGVLFYLLRRCSVSISQRNYFVASVRDANNDARCYTATLRCPQ